MVNFAKCQADWVPLSNHPLAWGYRYNGSLQGISRHRESQITLEGCRALCGEGIDWYPWSQSSNTMTTWILPIIGLILQAPFKSNALRATIVTLARWVGNPMASLSYISWNIWVTGRSALIVDMSVPMEEDISRRDTDYGSIRDSFFLLNVMNQYTMRTTVGQRKEAEGLLRIALFSKDIRVFNQVKECIPVNTSTTTSQEPVHTQAGCACGCHNETHPEGYLNEERQRLARELRGWRRRGVVPVFISTAWFIFSLVLSIQSAFGLVGQQAQAHDLALGLLLAWLPVLILASIVDRNPVAADEVRDKLNELVNCVWESLRDRNNKEAYKESVHVDDEKTKEDMRLWIEEISKACTETEDFKDPFVAFAGQGRTRWHYGCCHPILKDIEKAHIASNGRGWLHRNVMSRPQTQDTAEVTESQREVEHKIREEEQRARTLLVLGDVEGGLQWFDIRELWQIAASLMVVIGTIGGAFLLSYWVPTVGIGCRSGGYMIFGIVAFVLFASEMMVWWAIDLRHANLYQEKLSAILFVPAEIANSVWLVYIVLAQTFGAYQTCECMTSSWGRKNYMDLTQWAWTASSGNHHAWIAGTAVSVGIMGLAMLYILLEWCLQSHLNTSDPIKAAHGMRRVRTFRKLISWISWTNVATVTMRSRGAASSLKWSATTADVVDVNRRKERSRTSRVEDGTFEGALAGNTLSIPFKVTGMESGNTSESGDLSTEPALGPSMDWLSDVHARLKAVDPA